MYGYADKTPGVDGFAYPDQCLEDSPVRAGAAEFATRMGCCSSLFFDFFARLGDKDNATIDEDLEKWGNFLSFVSASCGQTLDAPCNATAIAFDVVFSNVNATYAADDVDAVLEALRKDLAANTGAQEAGVSASLASAADETSTTNASETRRKRADGDGIATTLSTGFAFSSKQATALSASLFAGDSYANGKLAEAVSTEGR